MTPELIVTSWFLTSELIESVLFADRLKYESKKSKSNHPSSTESSAGKYDSASSSAELPCVRLCVFPLSVMEVYCNVRNAGPVDVWSCKVLLCLCAGEQYSASSMDAISDDALFRDKLKHMGKCKFHFVCVGF